MAYAISYDQDGTRDLVNSPEDALASIANYLAVHRWKNGAPIAIEGYATNNAQDISKQSLKPKYTLAHYANMGYEPVEDAKISDLCTLLQLEKEDSTAYWFGFNNFYVITRYNHSELYAMAVFQLAEAIRVKKEARSLY